MDEFAKQQCCSLLLGVGGVALLGIKMAGWRITSESVLHN